MSSSSRGNVEDAAELHNLSPHVSREPPPEPSKSIWTRRSILLAFWAVVIALGVPHWVWTTSIHRSELPLESMNHWAEGNACQLHFPIYVRLVDSDPEAIYTRELASQVEHLVNGDQTQSLYAFHVTADGSNATVQSIQHVDPAVSGYKESALTVNVKADTSAKSTQASLRAWVPVLDILHNPGRTVDPATLAPFIANEIHKAFNAELHTMSYVLNGTPFKHQQQIESLEPGVKAKLDAKATRAFKYASTYHLTFSLFVSSGAPSAWDIEQALDETINPLLERLSSISEFTVDTQVQLFASFSPSIAGPQYDATTHEWKLQNSDLSGFINAAEWPLNPGIGSGPTINFVIFVPSKEQSPLVLAEGGGNSWLIPQWGGVQIFNPKGKQPKKLTAVDLQPTMLTFADQLAALLGVPQSPNSLALRISSLTRERATSMMLSASSTLGALSRLTLKLTSIAIPESVAKSVDETIRRLDVTCSDLREGRYRSALENARIAEGEAEHAFFEPSMVGQVYFPEEHKVAVYVPLLGPMAVPLIMAAINELKKLRDRKVKVA